MTGWENIHVVDGDDQRATSDQHNTLMTKALT